MYVPPSFAETDTAKLTEFVTQNSFATLTSNHGGELFASHLPLLLDRRSGSRGELVGHMARANPQWQSIDGQQVMAIFHGPHAHISSAWYESKNVVPTWNYVVAHVYGTCRVIDDRNQTWNIVRQYMEFFEPSSAPFQAEDEFIDSLLDAIVGFRVAIERIEGKSKLSQNHSKDRRQLVIRSLKEEGNEMQKQIAALMAQTLE